MLQFVQKQIAKFGYISAIKLLLCVDNQQSKCYNKNHRKRGEYMKPLTINVDTSALDETEEKVSRLLSLLKEVKEIIGSLKVED